MLRHGILKSKQEMLMAECQSCGQAFDLGNQGTNASGTYNDEYCSICFQKGGFTDPDITLPMMTQLIVNRMVGMGMGVDEARQKATILLSRLKRWRNQQAL